MRCTESIRTTIASGLRKQPRFGSTTAQISAAAATILASTRILQYTYSSPSRLGHKRSCTRKRQRRPLISTNNKGIRCLNYSVNGGKSAQGQGAEHSPQTNSCSGRSSNVVNSSIVYLCFVYTRRTKMKGRWSEALFGAKHLGPAAHVSAKGREEEIPHWTSTRWFRPQSLHQDSNQLSYSDTVGQVSVLTFYLAAGTVSENLKKKRLFPGIIWRRQTPHLEMRFECPGRIVFLRSVTCERRRFWIVISGHINLIIDFRGTQLLSWEI